MPVEPKTLAIVGYGQFGQFVHSLQQQYAPELKTVVVTSQAREDVSVVTLAEAAQCDIVILCVPIGRYEATLAALAPHLQPQTVVVDVATVKEVTEAVCRKYLRHQPYICTHPMFGPASYVKSQCSVRGFRIVVTQHTLPVAEYQQLRRWLETFGFVWIEMEAANHDRYLAETLFLTHYVAQVITVADFVRTDIDTVSFGFLMDAVESVRDDTDLFTDVYAHNQYCQATIERLEAAADTVQMRLRQ